MMKLSYRFLGILALALFFLMLLNRFVLHDALATAAVRLIRQPASYLFQRSAALRSVASEYRHIRDLTSENVHLRQENIALLVRLADQQTLLKENQFLRSSLKIPQRIGQPTLVAGIFMVNLGATGFEALINKGSSENVSQGDIVVTGEGVLVGKIRQTFPSYARIQLVSDPSLQVAAQVLGKNTRGIARGDLTRGMTLNLVIQEEGVSEGDTVISDGHDMFPAGLILGQVAHVETNPSDVFKKIRIQSVNTSALLGPVFILSPQ